MYFYHTLKLTSAAAATCVNPIKDYAKEAIGTLSITAEVQWNFDANAYVHEREHRGTGRNHQRYFETLEDFVVWHYKQVGLEPPSTIDVTEEIYTRVPIPSEPVKFIPISEPVESLLFPGTYTPEDIEADLIACTPCYSGD